MPHVLALLSLRVAAGDATDAIASQRVAHFAAIHAVTVLSIRAEDAHCGRDQNPSLAVTIVQVPCSRVDYGRRPAVAEASAPLISRAGEPRMQWIVERVKLPH